MVPAAEQDSKDKDGAANSTRLPADGEEANAIMARAGPARPPLKRFLQKPCACRRRCSTT